MLWTTLEIFISIGLIAHCARSLFFLKNIYPRRWMASIFFTLFLILHFLGNHLFPLDPYLHESRISHLFGNHVILLSLPAFFAVSITHMICLTLLRHRSIHYFWEGRTLHLTSGNKKISIEPRDILSVSSAIYIFHTSWGNPLKLFRVQTTQGIFSFDEALEENYWRKTKKTSFMSLSAGAIQAKRNANLLFGKARASSYFKEHFIADK